MLDMLNVQLLSLLVHKIPFALFRCGDEISFIAQKDAKLQLSTSFADLDTTASGFLIAPFAASTTYPLVLIQSDLHLSFKNESPAAISQQLCSALEPILDSVTSAGVAPKRSPLGALAIAESLAKDNSNRAHYATAFNTFMAALEEGRFDKLVLSRPKLVPLQHFSPVEAFFKACLEYKGMVSLSYSPYSGLYLGCSPEILLQGNREHLVTMALAGTMPFAGGDLPTLSQWTSKNRKEQAIVADYIRDTIAEYGVLLEEQGPYTALAGNVVHIKTEFSFALKEQVELSQVIAALHPTPAVCGLPKDVDFICAHEGYERGYYAGVLGPYQINGHSALYVNLRCMQIKDDLLAAVLIAGGGILTDSQMDSEFEETQHKMCAMLKLCK